MIQLSKYPPASELAPFIEYFWYYKTNKDNVCWKQQRVLFANMLPEGIFDLIFELGDSFEQLDAFNSRKLRPKAFIGGLFEKKYSHLPTGRIEMFGLRFLPGKAKHFIRQPLIEFKNRVVPLGDVWGNDGQNLQEQIFLAPNFLSRIKLLEQFLLQQFSKYYKPDQLLDHLITDIFQGNYNSGYLADKYFISERQLRRKFNSKIGLSPKSFIQAIRLSKFLHKMDKTKQNLTQVGNELGYFDQAHFINDFKKHTHLTPRQFQKAYSQVQRLFIS